MIQNTDSPNWTNIAQAIGALIAIPLTLISVIKLTIRDKKRASEIESLSIVASKLTLMQEESNERYKSSKKPRLKIDCNTDLTNKSVTLNFTNTNVNTSIIKFAMQYEKDIINEINIMNSTINDVNGTQIFWIELKYKNKPFDFISLELDYSTEEGYLFMQEIFVMYKKEKYGIAPGVIIEKQNSTN